MTIYHKFEEAGLGKAPFRFVGCNTGIIYQACPDAPVQPGSSCDFCGNAIMNEFWIEGADGKRFKVGCDCVKKTGDVGLVNTVTRAANKLRAERQAVLDKAKVEAATPAMMARIADQARNPHPFTHFAQQGKTNADYLMFAWENSGTKAKLALIREWLK